MEIKFKNLEFEVCEDNIYLTKFGNVNGGRIRENMSVYNFAEVQVAGQMKPSHLGVKMALSSEGWKMKYVSHEIKGNVLKIVQKTDIIEACTVFTAYEDSNAVRIFSTYKNISGEAIVLEEASSFCVTGFGVNGIDSAKNLDFYSFTQSHHAECQPRKMSFFDHGMFRGTIESQKRIAFANVGSWSTKERLPQGIIADNEKCEFLMFQIESNNSWYYEIGDKFNEYYLYLGINLTFNGWSKKLEPNEKYTTVNVAVTFGNSLNGVIGEMTKYRRHICGKSLADETLPAIFNEYMHLSWENPSEKQTAQIAKDIAKSGVEYYVLDCGWHDEQPPEEIFAYVGKWRESKTRFPGGVKKTIDLIHSLGMKAGLWIEPEVVGYKCKEMIDYYGDDCFLKRYGKKICVMRRLFLDFKKEKVRNYLTETIKYMVNGLGADYIKMDYNQDCGVGAENDATSFGEGLEKNAEAYLSWVEEVKAVFPGVLFETCSSGGMRMDYKTLEYFSILSTSDQVDFKKYPYIVSNIFCAVLPEQGAVWSYPVDDRNKKISAEQTIMNMINSCMGRIHLASPLFLLDEECFSLVKEGVEYYKKLNEVKKKTLPYFPAGFSEFGSDSCLFGLMFEEEKKLYLAVWSFVKDKEITLSFADEIKEAVVGYPSHKNVEYHINGKNLSVKLCGEYAARIFEIYFDKKGKDKC